MIRIRVCAALLVAGLLALLGAATARADAAPPVTNYDVAVVLSGSGEAAVTIDMDVDFSVTSGHGVVVTLPTRQSDGEGGHWLFDYSDLEIGSPTGAPTRQSRDTSQDELSIRVGEPDTTLTTAQRYRISYRVRGLVTSQHPGSGLDEFNWNAVGPDWDRELGDVDVRVTGPAPVERAACFVGPFADQAPCPAEVAGADVASHVGPLPPHTPVQVVAGFAPGTFGGAQPRRQTFWTAFDVTPVTGGVAGGILALGALVLGLTTRGLGRDRVYRGVTPGLRPTGPAATAPAPRRREVAVRFTPPDHATPGQVGVLLSDRVGTEEVAATVVDLAVRGHLTIAPVGGGALALTETPRSDDAALAPWEATLLTDLFRGGSRAVTADFADRRYAGLASQARSGLRDSVEDMGWFRGSSGAPLVLRIVGMMVLLGGGIATLVLVAFRLGLIGAAVLAVGLAAVAISFRGRSRSADGSAVLAQAEGFRLYLSTAEAATIRFEEGIDVYSRYLPWAMVFGVAERWTGIFDELRAAGRYEPTVAWSPGADQGSRLGASLGALSTTLSNSLSATPRHSGGSGSPTGSSGRSTSGSSGSSGFSGGGGMGGGGGSTW